MADLDPVTITIRRRVPTQNQSHYRHWSRYRQERDAWLVLLRQQLPPRQPVAIPVRLRIRSFRVRLCDFANLVGGAKPIPDALVRLGYLHDDAPQWFECAYEQFQVPAAEERTEIIFLDGLPAAGPSAAGGRR